MRPPTNNKPTLPEGVIIDDEDYPKLAKFKNTWFISGRGDVYVNTWSKGRAKAHKLHRVVMGVTNPKIEVDHINRNKLDNRKSNLRLCEHRFNGRNLSLKKNNTSGFSGVIWDKNRNKWLARIKLDYIERHIGRFETIEEAISARLFAEDYYFGEFAPNLEVVR